MSDALFELEPADDRTGNPDVCHVLMPNMAYACGGNILTKRGRFTVGIGTWDQITCPGCREHGEEALRVEMRRQQGQQAGVA